MKPKSPMPALRTVADQSRGLLAGLASADESMVDELLAERRREAAREDSESAQQASIDTLSLRTGV